MASDRPLAGESQKLARELLDRFTADHGPVIPSGPDALREWAAQIAHACYLAGFQDGAEDACRRGF